MRRYSTLEKKYDAFSKKCFCRVISNNKTSVILKQMDGVHIQRALWQFQSSITTEYVLEFSINR